MSFEVDFKDTFDTSTALSSMYLWLLFGFLSTMINCDLQRFIHSHPLARHIVAFIAFFFLFTIIDTNNKTNMATIWVKTFVVYVLFILTTKSKWYFAMPVLGLLLIDQSIKKHVSLMQSQNKIDIDTTLKYKEASRFINVFVTATIIAGAIHYIFVQKQEYGKSFSYSKFFLGTMTCSKPVQKTKLPFID